MEGSLAILVISFFLVALIYSSVGFGGGTSYLALLGQSFFFISQPQIKTTALLCNIIVVVGGTYIFYRSGKLDLKKSWPFLVASVPFAFLGGFWKLNDATFFVILGLSLVVASFLLWFKPGDQRPSLKNSTPLNFGIGGGIGFLSGLVGIGGGIFLSPILHFIRWDEAKKISALASVFILVNSISGLAGQLSQKPEIDWYFVLPLLAAVLVGGQIGSRLGATKFNSTHIKRVTAVLILVAGINILRDHL
ncbi:MAG TPA: sulfite exporter TauE/SafE family protein [Chryseosolibacter sp.]